MSEQPASGTDRYTPDHGLTLNLSADERETVFQLFSSACADDLRDRGHDERITSVLEKVINPHQSVDTATDRSD